MNISDKIDNGTATLADQELALKESHSAYSFAKLNIPGTDIEKCQETACKYSVYAYYFARDVPGANIKYCQENACKKPIGAYYFAKNIPEADVKYCRKSCDTYRYWFEKFDKMIAEMALI